MEIQDHLTSLLRNFFFFAILTLFFLIFIIFFICSEFCHTLKWNSHRFTCVPHPDPPLPPPSPPAPPKGFPSAPGPSACLMHPTWAGDLFHPRYYTCFDVCRSRSNSLNLIWNNWLVKIEKGVLQGCLLSPCLFNLYAEHMIQNVRLGELQAEI